MAEIIGVSLWILMGIKWGDWRNWSKYQPTIVYFIFCDVLYYLITYSHPLWSLEPTWPLKTKLICLFGEFIVFASTVLIFIGNYPTVRLFSTWWTLLWVIIYTVIEWILLKLGVFTYQNNWNLVDSFLFNILLFVFLRLYFKKPVVALLASFPICMILIYLNRIPIK